MLNKFWAFAEACDETHSLRAVRDLLASAVRGLGYDRFALVTHAPHSDLRSLDVLVHNWPSGAIEHLLNDHPQGQTNPLVAGLETTRDPIHWSSNPWRTGLGEDQLAWIERLKELVRGDGVSKAMRATLISASCSITGQGPFRQDRVIAGMRMANYAYHHIRYLQQPELTEAQRLTAREHECLYRSAVCGERPRVVARQMGVKVSTVRTLRQKANLRLDADNSEQAVWRMLETGQLFRRGRRSKPRTS